jgi:hypothetical protein
MALLQDIKKLFGPLLDDLEWRREEEDKVAAASSSDTSVEENPEDDWFGTITQAHPARARTS